MKMTMPLGYILLADNDYIAQRSSFRHRCIIDTYHYRIALASSHFLSLVTSGSSSDLICTAPTNLHELIQRIAQIAALPVTILTNRLAPMAKTCYVLSSRRSALPFVRQPRLTRFCSHLRTDRWERINLITAT